MKKSVLFILLFFVSSIVSSASIKQDLELVKVTSNVWSIVGHLTNRTKEKFSDTIFKDNYRFSLGNVKFEIYHRGQANTLGDDFV